MDCICDTLASDRTLGEEFDRFDGLIIDLAAALARVVADEIDDEIQRWLKQIADWLGIDRITIVEIYQPAGIARFTHSWTRTSHASLSSMLDLDALVPWTKQRVLAGQTVVMTSRDQLPKEASVDRESYYRYGPSSNVVVPIRVGGNVIGAISFASIAQERNWAPRMVRQFQTVAEIFGFGLERKRVVAETRRLRDELNYVSRVTTMGELAASLAHELNQPLAAILNNAEALQALLESDRLDLEEIKAGIGDIVQDDNRARDTIERVWKLFRRDSTNRSTIEVAELLSEIERIIRSEALMRGIALVIDVEPRLGRIVGERIQLEQAIINVVLNAFDAVAGNGERAREVRIEARAQAASGNLQMLVRDNGIGISAELMPKIFDAFFTTKAGGLGMGLVIVKSIINAHGGRISASPNTDFGTSFDISLPVGPP